jgi:hypothetical protein
LAFSDLGLLPRAKNVIPLDLTLNMSSDWT